MEQKIIPIILCGGKGSRLWPLSRQSYPKQFLTLYGEDNKSLLPAGVVKSSGDFQRGDAVEIISHVSEKIGQGLSAYSSTEVSRIKGCQTFEIEEKLGYPGRIALVHRDDLVLS